MKILFIAPLPPPITGHSLASEVLLESIIEEHEVQIVNLSKDSFKSGIDSIERITEVFQILWSVFIKVWSSDRIYLTVSESLAGNFKDLLIYLICIFKLNKVYIHLHGGSMQKLLFDKYKMIYLINRFFIRRLKGVIVLGESHVSTFSRFINRDKIFIVPNFSQDYLFLSESGIIKKHININNKIVILFLSNMQKEKGYDEIVDAFLLLDDEQKNKIEIHFAGRFDIENEKIQFQNKISGIQGVFYHGIVQGEYKKKLLNLANVFCLPTSFLEGQPVSILEAYAAGCFVLTTNNGGIIDIFEDGINGYQIEQSSNSICGNFKLLISNTKPILEIGLNNRNMAFHNYRTSIYINKLKKILVNNHK